MSFTNQANLANLAISVRGIGFDPGHGAGEGTRAVRPRSICSVGRTPAALKSFCRRWPLAMADEVSGTRP